MEVRRPQRKQTQIIQLISFTESLAEYLDIDAQLLRKYIRAARADMIYKEYQK